MRLSKLHSLLRASRIVGSSSSLVTLRNSICTSILTVDSSAKPESIFSYFPSFSIRLLHSNHNKRTDFTGGGKFQYEPTDDIEVIDEWEDEDEESEPQIGDGGDGGGFAFQGVKWGEKALCIAQEVLQRLGDDMELYAFKTTPRGYIYVRLDKVTDQYGCPCMEELERYSREYKKRLDEAGAAGEVPDDLALEVSSPGVERLLKVPEELQRFRDLPMRVSYTEDERFSAKTSTFMLESVHADSEECIWKLAEVRENRDPQNKGRPMSRKQRDLRIKLPFAAHKSVTLYLD